MRPALTTLAAALGAAGALAQTAPDAAGTAPAAAAPGLAASGPAAAASAASAPAVAASGIELRTAPSLQAPPRGAAGRQLPIIVRARELSGRPDIDAVAEGDVEFRRGTTVIHADRLTYDRKDDLARATGNVRISQDGNLFQGPELQLHVERFEGFFQSPTYRFGATGAGGTAGRIDFLEQTRAVATDATYTSCPADGSGDPPWLLSAERIAIDTDKNEGVARNAVLRFYGVPILGAPVLSFPLNDERKSGWLPPNLGIDSRSGVQASIPYYWNIAPNRDATFTPSLSSKRGFGLDTEFRYLEPSHAGETALKLMPYDRLTGDSRYALRTRHESLFAGDTLLQLRVRRVSDDDYWKDFPDEIDSLTRRLLGSSLSLSKPFGDWSTYARVQRWQVLQTEDPTTRIESPYERRPQIGARYQHNWNGGFDVSFETEYNRFANPDDRYLVNRHTGERVHALGSIARPFGSQGWVVTPKLSFNAASYSLDSTPTGGRRSASRFIPTLSVDSSWTLEREATLFGRTLTQTLEPRLLYVNTPYRRQDDLPNFDAYPKDFNVESIFTENVFSGVDRVSDEHQLTAGVTSRFLDPATGAETLRVGIAQRYLFRDQRITPDGEPLTRRFSNLLLFGSGAITSRWNVDALVTYDPENGRIERSVAGVRYSPGPYRTIGATYRLTRGLLEQVELGWQWPVYGADRRQPNGTLAGAAGSCQGALYSVGRVNYSTRDSRIIDSLVGLEYDAGCWIGRVVAERRSTGRSEANTRLMMQLELVGLSRIGSNPLGTLKDNIPGYRMLRDEKRTPSPFTPYD
ncbi:LPS-assembly protein LptD [Piscinibacter koreensis]|uniref:LPS-assembly protein LptD n=1 Tax=Piscinibacter koreensis TaxID=2742824 RepID=A0A7Y6NJU3_9BURK|nr:LPS assembly protein LptD [Schlegelella koreensis]NUZ04513.1 LPS-assembly protein LptD [Schlegelella koreensis]